MKKVLIIAGALYIGGAEKVCRDIGLHAFGRYSVDYLVFGEQIGDYESELTNAGCRVIHTAPPSDGHAAYYKFLVKLIRTERYDVVHSHTMFNSGWAMLAAKRCGVPVRIAHSHSALIVKRSLYQRAYETLMRRTILRCATVCAACGQKAGERLYGVKAYSSYGTLILNGIQTAAYSYNEENRKKIRDASGLNDRFVIGHAGHLAEVKNQSFLIQLMPKIQKIKPNAFLLLLGEGEDREKLQQQVETLKLTDCVRLMGNVSNVNEYLSAMDVFVFPSLYEGLPLTIVEVQANGLPCIISDRVPRDVFITDLLTPLPLEDENAWIEAVCSAKRHNSQSYSDIVKQSGLDTETFLDKVYALYEEKNTL